MNQVTVKPGDTLSGIAEREVGQASAWPEIARANRLPDPDRIQPGQVLLVPEPRDKRIVANPLLGLPGVVRAMNTLDDDQRQALGLSLRFIRAECQAKAQHAWEKHKAPMAAYWKACGVYAGHLANVLLGRPQVQGKPGPGHVSPSRLRRQLRRYRDGKVDLDMLLQTLDQFLGTEP